MNFTPTKYSLVCCADGHRFEDTGWCLADPQCGCPSLVRAEYEKKQYEPREDLDGFYRYADWLPVQRTLNGSGTPVTYRSTGLAAELGLENLGDRRSVPDCRPAKCCLHPFLWYKINLLL